MTTDEGELNRAEADSAQTAADHCVGYGRPPVEHRFKKGNRANPGGKRKVKPCKEMVPQLPTGSFHEMLMIETDRMVRVKAGGRMVEIPAIQALIRALAAGAPAKRSHTEEMPDIAGELQAAYERACRTPEEAAIAAAEEYAQQIAPDTRSASELMRDRTLRVVAADERKRLEKLDPIGTAVPHSQPSDDGWPA